jgi:predicted secreted protein
MNALRALFAAAILASSGPDAMAFDAASTAPTVVVDGMTAHKAHAPVGARIEVTFQAQFGAGFRWVLSSEPAPLTLLEESSKPLPQEKPGTTGGPEQQIFAFRADAPGKAVLVFDYRRPWLKDQPARKTRRIKIEIAPSD